LRKAIAAGLKQHLETFLTLLQMLCNTSTLAANQNSESFLTTKSKIVFGWLAFILVAASADEVYH